jgi:hypothetical protein
MGSPQFQQESLLDRASPQHHHPQRQSMPSQPINNASPALSHASPEIPRWMGESTALYNMNQGLAVSFNKDVPISYTLLLMEIYSL